MIQQIKMASTPVEKSKSSAIEPSGNGVFSALFATVGKLGKCTKIEDSNQSDKAAVSRKSSDEVNNGSLGALNGIFPFLPASPGALNHPSSDGLSSGTAQISGLLLTKAIQSTDVNLPLWVENNTNQPAVTNSSGVVATGVTNEAKNPAAVNVSLDADNSIDLQGFVNQTNENVYSDSGQTFQSSSYFSAASGIHGQNVNSGEAAKYISLSNKQTGQSKIGQAVSIPQTATQIELMQQATDVNPAIGTMTLQQASPSDVSLSNTANIQQSPDTVQLISMNPLQTSQSQTDSHIQSIFSSPYNFVYSTDTQQPDKTEKDVNPGMLTIPSQGANAPPGILNPSANLLVENAVQTVSPLWVENAVPTVNLSTDDSNQKANSNQMGIGINLSEDKTAILQTKTVPSATDMKNLESIPATETVVAKQSKDKGLLKSKIQTDKTAVVSDGNPESIATATATTKKNVSGQTDQDVIPATTVLQSPTSIKPDPSLQNSGVTAKSVSGFSAQSTADKDDTSKADLSTAALMSTTHTVVPISDASTQIQKPVLQQVTDQVLYNYNQKKSEFKMDLYPENLGKVSVKLSMENSVLTVSILADNPKTQSLLLSHAGHIQSVLQNSVDQTVQVVEPQQKQWYQQYQGNPHQSQQQDQPQQQQQHNRAYTLSDLAENSGNTGEDFLTVMQRLRMQVVLT